MLHSAHLGFGVALCLRGGKLRFEILALSLGLLTSTALQAQRTTATISGTITDATGSVVPDGDVSAVETSTGTTVSTRTNSEGFYVLPNLAPGGYRLRVQKSGFQSSVQEGIVLAVDQSATINISLKVGSQAESVTVTAEAPQVDVRSQVLTTVITRQMVDDLPLNGRNPLQLMSLAPDVSPSVPNGVFSYYGQFATRPESTNTFVSASGGRGNSSAFYLDGGVNEDPYTNVANIFPNPDAIQEFSYQTNSYSAKFGGRGGGVVNAVTRGGTNDFHGDVFEFLRNGDLNARNFFASTNDGLKRNQYGFAAGGPIQRNKTFFFVSWQATKLRSTPTQNVARTATAAERVGNFSEIPTQLVDPNTGVPFSNNQIPTSLLDPVSLKILDITPVGAPGTGLVFYPSRTVTNDNQWVTRVDHNFGEKFRVYGHYLYDLLNQPSQTIPTNLLTQSPNVYWKSQNAAVGATYLLRPNLVGTGTLTFNRVTILYTGPPNLPSLSQLGVNIPNLATLGSKTNLDFSIDGYFSSFWNGIYRIPRQSFDFNTNWTYIHGPHTIEFGGEFIRQYDTLAQDCFSDGYFTFGSQISGDNLVDFMLGKPDYFSQLPVEYNSLRRSVPALFANDTWKATRRLTLSLGVRWNAWVPWRDVAYNQVTVFDQTAANAGIHSTRYPNLPPGEFVGGDPGIPAGGIHSNYHLFDPRIGLAFDVFGDGKTSIRAGFGIYHDEPIAEGLNNEAAAPPFMVAVNIPFPPSFDNPYAGRVVPFPAPQPPPSSQIFPEPFYLTAYNPKVTDPTIQQWNFTIERQITSSLMARASYEGSEGYHLFGAVEGNPAVYIPGQSTFENVQQRRIMGQYFTHITLANSIGTSSFNGVALTLEKRMSHGLSFLGGFRWAKSLDEISQSDYSENNYTDPYNIKLNRGPSDFNVRKQFIFSYVWELPTPQKLGFVGRYVLGGWRSNGILTLRSGFPFTVYSGLGYSYSGSSSREFADLTGNPNLPSNRSTGAKVAEWFNTSAFTYNAPGTFGDSPRNFLEGPGFADFDLSMIKSFPIKKGHFAESQRVDFRAEFFNLFNRPNFQNPEGGFAQVADGPVFGQILGALDPRIIQFGLKYIF